MGRDHLHGYHAVCYARARQVSPATCLASITIGIASTLVDTLFMGFVGAAALAAGLAFGLGGREVAGRMWESWYAQGQQAAPKVQRAADAARDGAQREWTEPTRRVAMWADEPPRE